MQHRFVSAPEIRDKHGVPLTTVWQWASRGLVIDGHRRCLHSRALDHSNRPLYLETDALLFVAAWRVAVAKRRGICQGSQVGEVSPLPAPSVAQHLAELSA